jgi:hypothetical protein
MDDGKVYSGRGTLKSGRVIEVDNPAHAKAINQADHIIHMADFAAGDLKIRSTWCAPCRFTGFHWQKTCPKCGGPMEEVNE